MVKVNREKCIGCGACVAVCPSGFEMKNGKAGLKNSKASCIKDSASICPVEAISE